MKKLSRLIIFSVLFLACDDGSGISDQLLQPNVQKAKEFVNDLKNNNRHGALTQVNFYDDNAPISIEYNKHYDSVYDVIQPITAKRGLKSISKWKVIKDELNARSGDYSIQYDEILVPFAGNASNYDDPVFLFIGFEIGNGDGIQELGIITKKMCDADGGNIRFRHTVSNNQRKKLNS
jgi:hypothetical protein